MNLWKIYHFFIAFFCFNNMQAIEIQGHRGSRGLYPENTLPAFEAAIIAMADVIELDLLVTQDKEIVIYHDFFVNKDLCTYMDGTPITNTPLIYQMPLNEIKKLDCGRKQNAMFPKQVSIPETQIPTLRELFNFIKASPHPHAANVRLNLEIKINPLNPNLTVGPEEFASLVIKEVKNSQFEDRIYYSSFDPQVLSKIHQLESKAQIGLIISSKQAPKDLEMNDQWIKSIIQIAKNINAIILSPEYTLLNVSTINDFQQAGFKVIPWTPNDSINWHHLIHMGVDGIITDYPLDLIKYIHSN